MKTVSMSGSLRENVGKKDAKQIRNGGNIPCVMYGGSEQIHFYTDEKDFGKIIYTPEVFVIMIEIGGREYRCVLQDVQYHPVTDRVLHADFLEIIGDRHVVVSLPVRIEGNAKGVLRGGKLVRKTNRLKVRGLIPDLPDYLVVNIDDMDIGDTMRVKDLHYENLNFIDSPNNVIVTVKTSRSVQEGDEKQGGPGAGDNK